MLILALLCFSMEPSKSSICPLQALKRPLQFLGLFDTTLCNQTHIPAYKVGRAFERNKTPAGCSYLLIVLEIGEPV